jgi:hypothetical protein
MWLPSATTLVVSNTDATAGTLRQARLVEGDLVIWRDILFYGPVPALPPDALRAVRAGYLAEAGLGDPDSVQAEFARRDALLEEHDGRFSLWFGASLCDQLQLIEVLARLADRGVDPATISLLCIAEHPSRRFYGALAELSAGHLVEMAPMARPLNAAALALASAAWAAFCSPTPEGLVRFGPAMRLDRRTLAGREELRFLADAFARLVREYPSTRDGLSLTERRMLAAVADRPVGRVDLFAYCWSHDPRSFMGDPPFFALMNQLAQGEHPLLAVADDQISLTDDGRRVLDGEVDRVELRGIDVWIGGVHLTDGSWRFDEGRELVVGDG